MKKHLVTGVLLLSLSGSVSARPRHWYTSATWWAAEASMLTFVYTDYHTTSVNVSHGAYETHPFLIGTRPSNHALALVGLGEAVGWTFAHIKLYQHLHTDASNLIVPVITLPHLIAAQRNREVANGTH